jgi:hypothetical protein
VRTTIATVVLWTPGQGINHYIILALIIHECNGSMDVSVLCSQKKDFDSVIANIEGKIQEKA